MTSELLRTPLFAAHLRAGARMIPFSGWEMPVQYSGIIEEHLAVRRAAGLFDLSHMARFSITGPGALSLLNFAGTNEVTTLGVGRARYSLLCAEDGGVLDDILVYRLHDRYLVVGNASNRERDLAWFLQARDRAAGAVAVEDDSARLAMLALQGPRAAVILQPLTPVDLSELRYYGAVEGEVSGVPSLVARTGYTGEDGFELYFPADRAVPLWETLLEAGRGQGLLPAGLGARDTLRLEAAMPLYGHELSETVNPFEAGLERYVKLERGEFSGRQALLELAQRGVSRRLVGLAPRERAVPRQGYEVFADESQVGAITSGSFSPYLQRPIALAYVAAEAAGPGTELAVSIRQRRVPAAVVTLPFYRREQTT